MIVAKRTRLVLPMIALSIALLSVVAASALAQTDAKDWPMYNRDLAGSRHNPGETAINNSNAGQLVEKWRFPAKDSKDGIGVIHATPVVVNGYVYFGTVNEDPTFYKLAPDGTLRWSYRNPMYVPQQAKPGALQKVAKSLGVGLQRSSTGAIFSSALVTDDGVFFSDMEGWIYALDRATGKEKWKLSTRAKEFPDAHPMNLSMASPIMADGTLIIGGGTLEQIIAGSFFYRGSTGRGFVLAIDPKLGKLLWKYDLGVKPKPLDPPITITDASGAHTFYYGPGTSSIWSTPSFDAESGTIYFGTDVNTSPRQPTDDNKNLHTRESCSVIALDIRDGSEKWLTQINPADVWTNSMASYDPKEGRYKDQSIGDTPKLYTIPVDGKPTRVVGVGCKNGAFYVLNASNGRIIAHTPLYTGPPTYPLTPAPDKRVLALPSAIGGLQTGCATDGKTVYTNGIDALWLAAAAPLSPKGGPITGGRVVAISTDTQSERWRHERPKVASLGGPPPKAVYKDAGDPVASGIAVANGVVYFTGVASGKLVALDAASGSVLKEIDLGPVWSGPSVSRGRVYIGTGNTQFSPADYETFLPKKYSGVLYSFGLPGEDEVSRLGKGNE
jgi:polyvinyl alcohol dehydrogenase (cytochrome)